MWMDTTTLLLTQRVYSNKTRIKTLAHVDSLLKTPHTQRVYSNKTRIKTK